MRQKDQGEGPWERWLAGLQEVLALTERQGQALAQKDYSQVEVLLSRRGELLAGLEDVQDLFQRAGAPGTGDWEEANRLLREITCLDDANREAIDSYLSDLRGEVAELAKWRQVARAYGGGKDIPDRGINI